MKLDFLPSHNVLKSLLDYDPSTGLLYWRERAPSWFSGDDPVLQAKVWNDRYAGKEAFRSDVYGYRCGKLLGRNYRSHRIIWKLVYGDHPLVIDHINGDRADNRIANLRSVTQRENLRNAKRSKRNSSGVTGVKLLNKRWHAQAWHSGAQHHIGCFDTKEQAAAARKVFDASHGYHPTHGRAA